MNISEEIERKEKKAGDLHALVNHGVHYLNLAGAVFASSQKNYRGIQ